MTSAGMTGLPKIQLVYMMWCQERCKHSQTSVNLRRGTGDGVTFKRKPVRRDCANHPPRPLGRGHLHSAAVNGSVSQYFAFRPQGHQRITHRLSGHSM